MDHRRDDQLGADDEREQPVHTWVSPMPGDQHQYGATAVEAPPAHDEQMASSNGESHEGEHHQGATAVETPPAHDEQMASPNGESHEGDHHELTAPMVAPTPEPPAEAPVPLGPATTAERQVELMAPESRVQYRARWSDIQTGFVDDPTRAVRDADQLVADVMDGLAKTFAEERGHLEARWSQGNEDTENLRVALQRYRHFFGLLLKE
jgi:hypothetical protein